MLTKALTRRHAMEISAVACALVVLFLQLALSVKQESQTWDEGNHIFAGYRSWTNADFGLNPEHPPLVKLLAAAPLLSLPLQTPKLRGRDFKLEAFLDGKEFLYQNDADLILFRTRMAAARLTVALVITGVIAVGVLWAFYEFRYDARPAGLELNPSLAVYTQQLKPREAKTILTFARWHLLPESYLYHTLLFFQHPRQQKHKRCVPVNGDFI